MSIFELTKQIGWVIFPFNITAGSGTRNASKTIRAEFESQSPCVEISFENYCREAWHCDCTKSPFGGVMKRENKSIVLEDGSEIPLWVCLSCGDRAYGGINKDRRIVTKEVDKPKSV